MTFEKTLFIFQILYLFVIVSSTNINLKFKKK